MINGGEKGKAAPVKVEQIRLYSQTAQDVLDPQQAEGLRITQGEREYILFSGSRRASGSTSCSCAIRR